MVPWSRIRNSVNYPSKAEIKSGTGIPVVPDTKMNENVSPVESRSIVEACEDGFRQQLVIVREPNLSYQKRCFKDPLPKIIHFLSRIDHMTDFDYREVLSCVHIRRVSFQENNYFNFSVTIKSLRK